MSNQPHYRHHLLNHISTNGRGPHRNAMDITEFIVSSRNAALLYGDYSTYHRQSTKKLANCRRKLGLATKNRGKFTKKGDVTADQISQDHA